VQLVLKAGVKMRANDLIQALTRKLGANSQAELASVLGVTVATLINWKNRDEDLSPLQVASALVKSRYAAVQKSQLETI
jgi:DNA-binding transcriptional regulator YiaG